MEQFHFRSLEFYADSVGRQYSTYLKAPHAVRFKFAEAVAKFGDGAKHAVLRFSSLPEPQAAAQVADNIQAVDTSEARKRNLSAWEAAGKRQKT